MRSILSIFAFKYMSGYHWCVVLRVSSHHPIRCLLSQIRCLTRALTLTGSCGVFLRWVHVAFESLTGCLRSTNQMSEADAIHLAHVDWMKKNPKLTSVLTWEYINKPAVPFEDFRQEFFALATKLQKCKRGFSKFFKS